MTAPLMATVAAVASRPEHAVSKVPRDAITLVEGRGVEDDTHAGVTVQHRSRVRADPTQPNLRQVHLIHSEFFDEARAHGYELAQGDLGENILTAGLDVLALPRDARLYLGKQAVVRVTGLRNPCQQINNFRSGLLKVAITRDPNGQLVRKAGIMGVVERGGTIVPRDTIRIELPPGPHIPLDRV